MDNLIDSLFDSIEQDGMPHVNAHELYKTLGVKDIFRRWFSTQVEKHGFVEEEDYFTGEKESTGGRPEKDYLLTASAAKRIIVSSGEGGNKVFDYFAKLEKAWNTREVVVERAIQLLWGAHIKGWEEFDSARHVCDKISSELWKELVKIDRGTKPGKPFVDKVKEFRTTWANFRLTGEDVAIAYLETQRIIGVLQDIYGLENSTLRAVMSDLFDKLRYEDYRTIRGYLERDDDYVPSEKARKAIAALSLPKVLSASKNSQDNKIASLPA